MAGMDGNNPRVDLGSLAPAEHRLLRDHVAEALRDGILRAVLRPGTHLVETVIAEQMGVSRGPVREALVQLERQGLVTMEPRRGAVVRTMRPRDAWEVYTLRAELEALAIEYGRVHMQEQDIVRLQDMLTRMAELTDEHGLPVAVEQDLQFHAFICHLSRHRRLIRSFLDLDPLIWGLFLTVSNLLGTGAGAMFEKHRPIVEALAAHDFPRAQAAVRQHYLATATSLLSQEDSLTPPFATALT
ncbi:MAG TPA: GntR family transcriptional regulator [Firmicutes bacterium]|nr:GntR family transcriptional regulator [Bacillota bacterium]